MILHQYPYRTIRGGVCDDLQDTESAAGRVIVDRIFLWHVSGEAADGSATVDRSHASLLIV